ncbi:hypothetical protein KUG85_03720 [Nitratireductor sp. L1-7-SE]|uniref:Tat pathway signal protein n=1 Tax=Nitratireductor rhodophyticola TaxID=2854036 RepID=A0ABS7R2J5_9HYPH|nr:hypothetical protein [Nitratireductor rhodophyticola]MBY8915133.1 hypothetical protein [Nitratireductor rhodophyticola]MBY8919797.1 hypothetical protein [Nitratireductor rhodophyticola]
MPSRLLPSSLLSTAGRIALAVAGTLAATLPGAAQEPATGAIKLELNALQKSEKGCRIAFVVENAMGRDIARAAYEIALFNKEGLVDRLLVLDFQELPNEKTKVRRFDLADADCDAIGRVLINDASACEGDGIEPGDCIARLEATSRSTVTFGK